MRLDPLQQYAKLRKQLTEEKGRLENRLNQINQALGSDVAPEQITPSSTSGPAGVSPRPAQHRGRKPKAASQMTMREAIVQALSSHGPLDRKEMVKAVLDLGYVFTGKDPLSSMGPMLYGKNSPVLRKNGKFYLPGRKATQASREQKKPELAKKRTMSPEAKARISEAQKARWAKWRRAQ